MGYLPKIKLKYLLIFIAFSGTFFCPDAKAQNKQKVFVLQVRDMIDYRMSRYVELGLEEAKKSGATYVLIDMDTYGGVVHDADKIRMAILQFPKPVLVFINTNAASAGALISIACDSIYMSDGATIGASTVVDQEGKAVSDKYQSYMRSKMRATAEANKRDTAIAAAMVGVNVGNDTIYREGKVLTLSTAEAIRLDFCDGKANSIQEVLQKNNISNYELVKYKLSFLHEVELFFLNPFLRILLIILILAGLYFEMKAPGLGLPIIVSIVSALLYFVPSYLHGFAQYWEILLFLFGVALVILEIFVLPGGIAGIVGALCAVAGLTLVMLNNDYFDFSMVSTDSLVQALLVLFVAMVGGTMLFFIGASKLLDYKSFRKLTLQDKLESKDGYTSSFLKESMLGKTGTAYTVLRPSGKVMINEVLYDAYSRNEFIEQGSEVIVIEESTTSLKVKKK
ncbi:MAG: nodulation protein NfeD [Cytophagaceae bacterium]|nr:nodulation protein NfeD [Cytophagaceae bacterium]